MKYNITIIISVLSLLFISSCKSTKYVPKDKLLLVKNIIEVNGNKDTNNNLNPYIIQQPNSKAAGMKLGLWFYNIGNKDFEKKWNKRIEKYKDTTNTFTKIVSLKQSIGWANFWKDFNKWIFKNGESPVLLNFNKTKKTLKNLQLYYIYEGYFNAKVDFQIDTLKNKKAKVRYKVNTGETYEIDSVNYQIDSKIIEVLYHMGQVGTLIKKGDVFKKSNFEEEARRLTKIIRNAGVYHFSKSSINYTEIDSTSVNHKTNVLVEITDRIIEKADTLVKLPYYISTIKEVNVYTDYSYSKRHMSINDSISYNGINFYAYNKIRYNPKSLALSIFIKPGHTYSDIKNELTRDHLQDLKNFKTIKIKYEEVEGNQLIATIFLTPSKQYYIDLEGELTHNNIKPFAISGKASINNKNTFKGSEILQLGLQGAFINVAGIDRSSFFNAWEIGADASFIVPRFLIPFNTNNSFLRKYNPNTTFTLGTSFQKNIGLDKQRFTTIFDYSWRSNKKINHSLDLFNGQFIRNINVTSFFDVYKSEYTKLVQIQKANSEYLSPDLLNGDHPNPLEFMLTALNNDDFQDNKEDYLKMKNINKRYNIITEDVLVPTISYKITYNTQTNYKDKDFSYIHVKVASSGLLTSALVKNTDIKEPKQIFGINIAQYFKLDAEYRKHWNLNYNNILAFRSSIGYAIPYGNSSSIPFSRSYFAGGPNDIRAWHIYELGPGSEKTGLEFNVGNLKMLANLEYRFDIVGSFKGALFVDAGNIWDTTNTDLTEEGAQFVGAKSITNIAIGSGFGLRYDFSFIVLRGDFGYKVYEPYHQIGNKWFNHSVLVLLLLILG